MEFWLDNDEHLWDLPALFWGRSPVSNEHALVCLFCLGLRNYALWCADILSLLKLILYRSRTRQGSYETRNLLGLMSVTIFAAMSRVLLFSIWLYVFNHGQFSSIMTLIAYYTFFSMIIVFHIVVNKKKPVFSFPFVLGLLNVELLLTFDPH